MSVAGKIAALFAALTQDDLDAMPPAERRRFSDLCSHWIGSPRSRRRPGPNPASWSY
jgi:hypothetical protein